MLTSISIKNYALIDYLNVSFTNGFTVITGETGAGKSILLGGLSLVLGKRADLSSLRNKEQKCIIEAEFDIVKYKLDAFFEAANLDFEATTIIRREILPSGKSRAFVNDSPVTLDILSRLGDRLIDVHSQHQTLQLTNNDFQLKVIDALAVNGVLITEFEKKLQGYRIALRELSQLVDFQKNETKEQDYNTFLLKELEETPLTVGIQTELEGQLEQLSNVETIMEGLSKGDQLLNNEQIGALHILSELKQISGKLASYGGQYEKLYERIQSIFLEVDDIANELQAFQEDVEADPQLLGEVNEKLQRLYDLQKKHNVQEIAELILVKEQLAEKVSATENIEAKIKEKQSELLLQESKLNAVAGVLRKRREKVIPLLKKQLEDMLLPLGMANASFQIEIKPALEFNNKGKDDLSFLFSANKGMDYGLLKKVASGGELSRIMLTVKSILAKYEQLPTMMFDEIDTGVSGEVSNKMGDIMKEMSGTMQIFSITHLPQVASKGDYHFKVYKEDDAEVTNTKMKELTVEERVVELAEMLGGKELSDSALAHAKELLG
ncbi:MAG: DNA repair protein RecN [Cellulophaga sp.]